MARRHPLVSTVGVAIVLAVLPGAISLAQNAPAPEPGAADFGKVFQACAASVVRVEQGSVTGTGFVVDAERGFILTCFHNVSSDETPIQVQFYPDAASGRRTGGVERLKIDRTRGADWALLQVESLPNGVKALTLADNHDWRPLQKVLVIGFPGKAGQGHVPWDARERQLGGIQVPAYENYLPPLDGRLESGYSGGPVLDEHGHLLGMLALNIEEADKVFALRVGRIRDLLLTAVKELSGETGKRVALDGLAASLTPPRAWKRRAAPPNRPEVRARFVDPVDRAELQIAVLNKTVAQDLSFFRRSALATLPPEWEDYRLSIDERWLPDDFSLPKKPVDTLFQIARFSVQGRAHRHMLVAFDLGESVHALSFQAPAEVFEARRALFESVVISYEWSPKLEAARLFASPEATVRTLRRAVAQRSAEWFLSCFDVDEWTRRQYQDADFDRLDANARQAAVTETARELEANLDALADDIGATFRIVPAILQGDEATVRIVTPGDASQEIDRELLLKRDAERRWKIVALTMDAHARARRLEAEDAMDLALRALLARDTEAFLALCDLEAMLRLRAADAQGDRPDTVQELRGVLSERDIPALASCLEETPTRFERVEDETLPLVRFLGRASDAHRDAPPRLTLTFEGRAGGWKLVDLRYQ